MFHAGLLWKYKVNRTLTEEERHLQLMQNQRLDVNPVDQGALIKLNSTYLESLDKYFMEKGWITLGAVLVVLISAGLMAGMCYAIFSTMGQGVHGGKEYLAYYEMIGAVVIFSVPLAVGFFLLKYEMWRLTHYPIRLNRKNRTVYVFRQDKSILSVPWDDVFFTLNKENSRPMANLWEIQGHVMDKDGQTIRETFAFSDVNDQDIIHQHWEFLRRYMEDGPLDLVKTVKLYAPVDRRKEKFREGLMRLVAEEAVMAPLVAIVFSPFTFLQACARWMAMRTCTIPVWPPEIEAACAIDPNDPWVRDARRPG